MESPLSPDPIEKSAPRPLARSRGKRRKLFWGCVGVIAVGLLLGVRAYGPTLVTRYINDLLQRNPLYTGQIDSVELSVWRGAYRLKGIVIRQTMGNVPVPFFTAREVELALEWRSLWHGEVVGTLRMDQPELNFVDASDQDGKQTGAHGAWMGLIAKLFPFRINTATIKNGTVNLRTYEGPVPLNVHLTQVEITVSDLGNIQEETAPLVATVTASALVMDQAKCECYVQLDPSSYYPTFRLSARLLGLDVTAVNGFAQHYGAFDFEKGWFDFVVEAEAKEGLINGYAKALFRQLQILKVPKDFEDGKILEGIWQGILSVVAFLFKNHDRDQFGTLVPFEGDLTGGTNPDYPALLVNVLRNAFVEAYLPRFEGRREEVSELEFLPPQPFSPPSTNALSGF